VPQPTTPLRATISSLEERLLASQEEGLTHVVSNLRQGLIVLFQRGTTLQENCERFGLSLHVFTLRMLRMYPLCALKYLVSSPLSANSVH
jgi:hypothetical protein